MVTPGTPPIPHVGGPISMGSAAAAMTSATIAGKDPPTEEIQEHFLDITFFDKSNTLMGGK